MKEGKIKCTARRRRMLWVGVFLLVYCCCYLVLSSLGGYVWTQSGVVRYPISYLAVTDIIQWQPKFMFCQVFQDIQGRRVIRASPLGWVFSPLILLDQRFVHPTSRLIPIRSPEESNDPGPKSGK
ncbi:MAG: hypothetical protein JSU94_04340 [Phycisphaerales bacterium]|nr:MAG: hypothetical protein JSU94_04340 [Phycisphaerales bacterium]